MTSRRDWAPAPADARELRDAMGRDIASAHACLTALICAVHAGDMAAVEACIRALHALGDRIDSTDLLQWCAVVPPLNAPTDVIGVAAMLPTLVAAWERTQHALVSLAFSQAVAAGLGPGLPVDAAADPGSATVRHYECATDNSAVDSGTPPSTRPDAPFHPHH